MASGKVYEGTLEEITAQYGPELRGHRLRVQIDDEASAPPDEIADASEWTRAFREWAVSHRPASVRLSDEITDRASIYEGRD